MTEMKFHEGDLVRVIGSDQYCLPHIGKVLTITAVYPRSYFPYEAGQEIPLFLKEDELELVMTTCILPTLKKRGKDA